MVEKLTPYDWQLADIERIRDAGYRALLAVAPGGGKTYLSTLALLDATADDPNAQVLVIAPQSTHKSAWKKAMAQAGGDHEVRVIGRGNKAQRAALADFEWGVPGWYVCTPQFFTRSFDENWNPTGVILDESHTLSNPSTRGQKLLSGYTRRDTDTLATRAKFKLALSGTPARNRFELLWGVAKFLWPELTGYGEVAQMPLSAWKDARMTSRFSPFNRSGKEYLDEIVPGKLFRDMPCVIQHKRRERCCDFHPDGFMPVAEPEVRRVVVGLTKNQVAAIRGLEEKGVAWLQENPLVTELPITQQLRIRQGILGELSVEDDPETGKQRVWLEPDAKSPFADMVEEILDQEGDDPVLVLTASKMFAKYLTARLVARGVSARELSGDTRRTRDRDVEGFGDTYRVAVAVIDAVGTGTDGLGRRCSTEIWTDRSLDRTANDQARARLDRMGQQRRVLRFELFDDLGYSERQWTRQALADEKLGASLRV